MIENNYSKVETTESTVIFALNSDEFGESTSFAYYYTADNRFWI